MPADLVRTIADRIGVSPASLLQHFGSKEGLLMAVLAEWDRHTVEASLTDVAGLDYFRRLPEVMAAHLENRGLLELFSTIAAEASSPTHPAREFIQRRYTFNLATLATHLRQAVDDGQIAPLAADEIDQEVRLVTAVLDGIGLQWLLDPSTDFVGSVSGLHQPQHHPLAQQPPLSSRVGRPRGGGGGRRRQC